VLTFALKLFVHFRDLGLHIVKFGVQVFISDKLSLCLSVDVPHFIEQHHRGIKRERDR
jgi:hypothetical protein